MTNITKDNNYKIYAHINRTNGKVYIGQTKQSVEQRWRNGYGYNKSPRFYNAIQKYGWDNFEHIVLIENLSLKEANIIEMELIKKYNTTNEVFGYNIAFGGDNKTISQIAIEKMKISKEKNRNKYSFLQEVYQYNMNGDYLNKYDSYREASRQTGVYRGNISACCRGLAKSAGGFLWSNEKVNNINYNSMKQRQVDRFTKEAIYIDSFITAKLAGAKLGINSSEIYACCNGERKSAGGFIWYFHEDVEKLQPYNNDIYKQVKQIDKETFEVINIFSTITEASKTTGINAGGISQCCLGNLKTSGGYIWKYFNDNSDLNGYFDNYRNDGKYTKQINKSTNEIICIYRSITEASNITNVTHCNISNCLCGRKKSAGGFKWEYSDEEEYMKFHNKTN